jgi:hypothetical protein
MSVYWPGVHLSFPSTRNIPQQRCLETRSGTYYKLQISTRIRAFEHSVSNIADQLINFEGRSLPLCKVKVTEQLTACQVFVPKGLVSNKMAGLLLNKQKRVSRFSVM